MKRSFLLAKALLLTACAAVCFVQPAHAEATADDIANSTSNPPVNPPVAPLVNDEEISEAATPEETATQTNPDLQEPVADFTPDAALQVDPAAGDRSLTPRPGTASTSAAALIALPDALEVAQTPAPAPVPTQPATATRISVNGRSYVGVGVNLGVTGDTAIGNTSFAAFSKVALTNNISVRPAILVTNAVTFLVPLTYDFPLVSAGAIQFNPYVGAGIAISTRNEAVDFLVTGGLDFPITDRLTATAAANFAPAGGLDVGLVFGLAYTFGR